MGWGRLLRGLRIPLPDTGFCWLRQDVVAICLSSIVAETGSVTCRRNFYQELRTDMPRQIEIDEKEWGVSLANAIVTAGSDDIIVVHSEEQRRLGERLWKLHRPNITIHFLLKSDLNPRPDLDPGTTTNSSE
jgi:hypothetical protein